jgi:hypothetical protein
MIQHRPISQIQQLQCTVLFAFCIPMNHHDSLPCLSSELPDEKAVCSVFIPSLPSLSRGSLVDIAFVVFF